jgi:hypothetical protein
MKPSAYVRIDVSFTRWSRRAGEAFIWWEIPAHTVFLSTPWIHPRLRRRVHRRGRR